MFFFVFFLVFFFCCCFFFFFFWGGGLGRVCQKILVNQLWNQLCSFQAPSLGKFITPYAAVLHDIKVFVEQGGGGDVAAVAASVLTRVEGREVRPVWAMLPHLLLEVRVNASHCKTSPTILSKRHVLVMDGSASYVTSLTRVLRCFWNPRSP